MISRRLFAALGLAGLTLAGCGKPADPSAGVPGTIRFSVLSTESSQNMQAYWKPILADMEKQTGLKVEPVFTSNYTLLIEAMKFKKTDAGWFSNRSGLEAVRQGGGEVFARTFDPSGTDGYKSVLLVQAKSHLTLDDVLKCNKTLNLGLGDVLSTSGTLAPMAYLFAPRDIEPEKCFKQVRSGGSHQTNLFALAAGQLDVSTSNTTTLLLNREHGRNEYQRVRVIWESPTLPEDPIVWRKDLDPAVKEKLRQFFLTYGQGPSPEAVRQRRDMAVIKIGGFKPADNNHLLPVREMEATDLWQKAKKTGDAGKISAAKAALEAVTAQRVALEARTRAPAAAQ